MGPRGLLNISKLNITAFWLNKKDFILEQSEPVRLKKNDFDSFPQGLAILQSNVARVTSPNFFCPSVIYTPTYVKHGPRFDKNIIPI